MKKDKNLNVGSSMKKKPINNDHWEMNFNSTPKGSDMPPSDQWLPRPGKERPTPHRKINQCDH